MHAKFNFFTQSLSEKNINNSRILNYFLPSLSGGVNIFYYCFTFIFHQHLLPPNADLDKKANIATSHLCILFDG